MYVLPFNFKERRAETIEEALRTLDQVNDVLLRQVVVGDQPTVIETIKYDVHLTRQNLENLMSKNRDTTAPQVMIADATSLLEKTNLTLLSILRFQVIFNSLKLYKFTSCRTFLSSNSNETVNCHKLTSFLMGLPL